MGRELHLWKYDISKIRYNYLSNFCRQYPEWKKYGKYGLSAVKYNGESHGSGISSPTEIQAIKNAKYDSNVKLVEMTCKEADPEIWHFILLNVTEGRTYEEMPVPRGRSQFYNSRRKFFYILDKKLP